MKPECKGIALVELMIVVIMVSVLATVLWNLHVSSPNRRILMRESKAGDLVIQSALEEIRRHLSLARRTSSIGSPVTFETGGYTDTIEIRYHGIDTKYFVDDEWNLVRYDGTSTELLAPEVEALKVTRVGMKTLVVTVVTRPRQEDGREGTIPRQSRSVVVPAEGIWR